MPGLSLGLGVGLSGNRPRPQQKEPLCLAIERKVRVTASHDDQVLTLAPHVVYTRGKKKTPTVDAVLSQRDGKPVNRETLRTYAVADLSSIALTDDGFTVSSDFEADDPVYASRTICIVQTVQESDNSI